MIPREELETLYEGLAFPSALKLRKAVELRERQRAARVPRPADYQPWTISLKEAREFVAKQGQRQLLAKPQTYDGKIIASRADERWAADLISYTSQSAVIDRKRFQYILVVQDIFTRFLWTRALLSTKAAEVRDAFKSIVDECRVPKELSTDRGTEFDNREFRVFLETKSIEHRWKVGVNDLATVDAAIGTLKKTLTRLTSTPGKGNWAQELAAATTAYNATPHGHLDGEAPEETTGESEAAKSLRFDLRKQAGEDVQTQNDATSRKRARLEELGAYREPVESSLRGLKERGFKPRYKSGPPIRVVRVGDGEVVGTNAAGQETRARAKDVLPVPPDSTATRDAPGQGRTGDERITRIKRGKTELLKDRARVILATPRTQLQFRGLLTAEERATLKEAKLTPVKFLRLWPEFFALQGKQWRTVGSSSSAPRQSTLI